MRGAPIDQFSRCWFALRDPGLGNRRFWGSGRPQGLRKPCQKAGGFAPQLLAGFSEPLGPSRPPKSTSSEPGVAQRKPMSHLLSWTMGAPRTYPRWESCANGAQTVQIDLPKRVDPGSQRLQSGPKPFKGRGRRSSHLHCSVNSVRFLKFFALVCFRSRGPPGGFRRPREG